MADVSRSKESWGRLLHGADSAWHDLDRIVFDGVTHVRYPAGRTLLAQSGRQKVVYRIQEGFVKLLYRVADGDEVVVGVRGPGRVVGLDAALLQTPSQIAAVTLTDCSAIEIQCDNLLARLSESPSLLMSLLRILSLEVREQIDRSAVFASVPARRRLELLLAQLAGVLGTAEAGGAIRLNMPLVQRELAEAIHVTPETLSRLLAELEEHALIERRHGRITLLTRSLMASLPPTALHDLP